MEKLELKILYYRLLQEKECNMAPITPVMMNRKETFYIKSQEEILKNKKHPHCDKLECKLLNRLEDTLVILLLF
ncbi:hypothetical protein, partial [Streptococcus suis]